VVAECSSRIAKSGSHAHSFQIRSDRFTIFTSDALSPVTTGDRVRFDYEVRRLKSGYRNEYFAVIPETLVIEVPGDLEGEVEGVVYVLSNQSMPGLLKVGFTTGTATNRAAALSGVTSVPTGFKVEWSLPVIGSPRAVEQRAHAHLAKFRSGKEFFRISLDEAKSACIRSFAEIYPEQASRMDEAFSKRAADELNRRDELARIQVQKEQAKAEEDERRAFNESREGRWLNEGCAKTVIRDFLYEPNRNYPSFFGKLIRQKYDDFLEITVKPYQEDGQLKWLFGVHGRLKEKYAQDSKAGFTHDECITAAMDFASNHGVDNYRLCVEISNIFIEQPPELPEDYLNPKVTLEIPNLDDLIIRPAREIITRYGRKKLVR
jgi:hypothetical protein